ncbi:MAG: nuclease-related domain-containing protein [Hormoscilla sp.]
MKILKQSPSLREAFQKRIQEKKSTQREAIQEKIGGGLLGKVGGFLFDVNQMGNQIKGNLGEGWVSLLMTTLSDRWILFQNALIPGDRPGSLTEIDHLIIGPGGIFIVEVKTWKGSFSAYNDKWKMRAGSGWEKIFNSPTSQNAYHLKMLLRWMTDEIENFPSDRVIAPVVFTVAKWVETTECSVPVLHGAKSFLEMLVNYPDCLTSEQVQRISSLVENYTLPLMTEKYSSVSKPILKKKDRIKYVSKPLPSPQTDKNGGVAKQAKNDITEWLKSLPQTLKVENVENNFNYQKMGIDLLLTTTNGYFKLGIVGDRWHKSGNFYFQTYSNKNLEKQSIFMSAEIDWLLYYFIIPRTLYMLPMPKTRDWFVANIERFSERSTNSTAKENQSYTRKGRLVPIEIVIQEVKGVRKQQF